MVAVVIYLWVGFAFVTGLAADARGRDSWGWFFIALFFGGFFALIAVLVMNELPPETEDADGEAPVSADT